VLPVGSRLVLHCFLIMRSTTSHPFLLSVSVGYLPRKRLQLAALLPQFPLSICVYASSHQSCPPRYPGRLVCQCRSGAHSMRSRCHCSPPVTTNTMVCAGFVSSDVTLALLRKHHHGKLPTVIVSAVLSSSVVHPAAICNHSCTSHTFAPHEASALDPLPCYVLTRQTMSGCR